MKLLLILALLPLAALADNNICKTQERTELSRDDQGRSVVKKITEQICVDTTSIRLETGYTENCIVPSKIHASVETNALLCQLPDGMWKHVFLIDGNRPASKQPTITNPDFNRHREPSFWALLTNGSRMLDREQQEVHNSVVATALNEAKLGQKVTWIVGDARGYAMPVAAWETSRGICRHVQTWTNRKNREISNDATSCYDTSLGQWIWQK